jgi:hypothetical protein
MKEKIELRVLNEHASRVFGLNEGEAIGSLVRKISISPDDPRMTAIANEQQRLRSEHDFLFTAWQIKRSYTQEELERATLLQLLIPTVFEPAGEECGTVYIEDTACPRCGAGGQQLTELKLDLRTIPANKDIARTIADEIVVSHRLARIIADFGISGVELRPVRDRLPELTDSIDLAAVPSGRLLLDESNRLGIEPNSWKFDVWLHDDAQRKALDAACLEYKSDIDQMSVAHSRSTRRWYQPLAISKNLNIVPPSSFGVDPFGSTEDATRCANQDTLGLNQISELTIARYGAELSDYHVTNEYVGVRRGLLRPSRPILISSRFFRILRERKVKGFEVQLAHVVE